MRIFVTGATGFLGRQLVDALRARGDEVVAVGSKDCDLTQPDALFRHPEPFDQIWHLAAWTQAGDFCLRHPGEQWIINQKINTHVLDWWQAFQPQAKMIAIGTSCAYAPDSELVEENYMAGEPIDSLYAYAMTKRMLLAGMRALGRQYGLRWLCLVPSTLFGPGYHANGRQRHFIFDLIEKIWRGRLRGEPVVLWGDGEQRRELSYLPDFVGAALTLGSRAENDLVNIGSGEEFSIRWYAGRIGEYVGYDPARIQYYTDKYVGARSKRLSIERLKTYMPEYTPTPIEESLRETVRWWGEGMKAD